MCYTIEINLTREQIEKRFGVTLTNRRYQSQSRISAFSLPELPVINMNNPNTAKLFFWGLIPFWIKDEEAAKQIRTKTFNAKAETLSEKPSFRNLIKSKRCLVITNGFYEWQTRDKIKQPYFIHLKNLKPFALAGLYDTWTNKITGEILGTFTVITTRANPLMEEIHNTKKRMPVILSETLEKVWLDQKLKEPEILNMLQPFDENLMTVKEIDRTLFARKN
ncbi:MAG: SOS response-associated peptidase [Bacteroidales bacterium]|nr:SOS response-associated peptidase [Bacteroidales bacterium]